MPPSDLRPDADRPIPLTPSAHDAQGRTRAGAFLLLLALLLTAAGALLQHLASATGLPPDAGAAARLLVAHQDLYILASWTRLAASILGAIGAFFLAARRIATSFPGSAFWLVAGTGYLFLAGLMAFRATGFMVLAAHQADMPVLFEAARATLQAIGVVGNVMVYGGLLGVFWGESRAQGPAVPAALSSLVALCCGLGAVGQVLSWFAPTQETAAILGYVLYPMVVLLLPFAIQVAWPGTSFVWARGRPAETET